MSPTPETNGARILADRVAATLSRPLDQEPPAVEEIEPATARFEIETPIGRYAVEVIAL